MDNQTTNVLADDSVLDLIREAYVHARPEMSHLKTKLTLESSVEELGIQSVAALEMAGYVEEQLDVQFADDELASINGIGDLARLIRSHAARARARQGGAQS